MATTATTTPTDTPPPTTAGTSAKEKKEQVWKHLVEHKEQCPTSTSEDPAERQWPSYNEVLQDVRKSDYNEVLTCPFDLHPDRNQIQWKGFGLGNLRTSNQKAQQQRRCKTICPNGVVCCAKLELFPFPENGVKGRPYTGLLAPAQTVEHCMVRLSSALAPMDDQSNGRVARMMFGPKLVNAKIFPGVAIKLFRSKHNMESANIVFLGCKVGQPEDNFFEHCLSSQLTSRMPATLKPILRLFKKYSEHPLALGISNLCGYHANGDMCEDLNFPFCLTLKPRVVLSSYKSDCSSPKEEEEQQQSSTKAKTAKVNDSFLDDIRSIPSGTVLYDVFASPDPLSVADPSKLQRIGRLVSTSGMMESPPDDGLFFRHQKKDEDFALRPHWKQDYLNTQVVLSDGTKGTAATLAGWQLFEDQIQQKDYVDFEPTKKG